MMKNYGWLLLVLIITLGLCGCSNEKPVVFMATVIEGGDTLLVEPQKDSNEYKSSDKIAVHTSNALIVNGKDKKILLSDIMAGQTLEITYNGMIAESYPAQIQAIKIKVLD